MMTIKAAIEYLNNNATDEVFWLGQVDIEQIDSLEDNLGIILPHGWWRRGDWRGDFRNSG